MKILLAGGLGFIGAWVTKKLVEQGHECIVLDNVADYGIMGREELDELMKKRLELINAPITHLKASITDELLQIPSVDVVIHLASFPRQKVVQNDPVAASDIMVGGLLNLLRYSVNNSIKRFVYISSSLVYGNHHMYANELDKCNPIGEYAIMKYTGELLVNDYNRRGLLNTVNIRPCAVYGEYDMRDRVISKFVHAALKNEPINVYGPDQILDFTHVEDTANGIVLAAVSKAQGTFNISLSGNLRTLKEVAKLVVEITESNSPIVVKNHDASFPKRDLLGITNARASFNFSPSIDLEDGLRRYIDWVKSTSPTR